MTTHSQLHSPNAKNKTTPVVENEREPAATEKRGQEPADTLAKGGAAADGGERFEGALEALDPREPSRDNPEERDESMSDSPARPSLSERDADRFAMAFRPSWAPLAGDPPPQAAAGVSRVPPSSDEITQRTVREERDVSLALPGRRRLGVLAALSIASFLALMYWGISNSTLRAPATARVTSTMYVAKPAPAPEPHAHGKGSDQALSETATAPAEPSAPVRRGPSLADPEVAAPSAEPAVNAAAEAPQAVEAPASAAAETQPTTPAAEPQAAAPTQPETAESAKAPAAPAPASATTVQPASDLALAAQPPQTAAAPAASPEPAVREAAGSTPAANPQPSQSASQLTAATNAGLKSPKPEHARAPLLMVRALPESAQLLLDGQRMANPFEVRLPRGYKHRIEARSEGYEASSQLVDIESDARLTITLRRATPSPEPRLQVKPLASRARGAGFVTTNPY